MPRKALQRYPDRTLDKLINASLPPQLARQYLSKVRHWERAKGKEWLAARLKAIWNMALLERSGLSAQIPQVARSARIAVADSGYPKGVEGELVRRFAKLQSPAKLRAASVAFRAYTALKLDETSSAQRTKAETTIMSKLPETAAPSEVYRLCVVEPWMKDRRFVCDRSSLKFDNLNRLSGTSRYPSCLQIPGKDLSAKPYLSAVASLITKGWVPEPLIRALGDWQLRQDAEWFQRGCGDMTLGKISVIQEGGAKARVVAMPNAWIQFYCMPYHNHVMRTIRQLDAGRWLQEGSQYGMSCCTCQSIGVAMALVALKQQQFCAAVDLSSATDRFPLDYQARTCSMLGIAEFGDALVDLKGPWRGLEGSTTTRWWYQVGQPMGLYGSFPLFHLSHYLLLNSLAADLGLEANGSNFAVLGDDVLIFNAELRRKYTWALDCLGVPVSQHKCYEGDLVEFAGFIITKCGKSATAYRPYKHDTSGEIHVMNACHAIGHAVSAWSPYWARAYDEYVKTRGMRDLTLEPLYSDPEETVGISGLPGSRWIGSCFNTALYYPLTRWTPSESFNAVFLDRIQSHWEKERFALLKEGELLIDIGHKGVTDPSKFDPATYLKEDLALKARNPFRTFGTDPLIRALRKQQEELR